VNRKTVRLSVRDAIAEVTIDRPGKLNALNEAVRGELTEVFDELAGRDDVKVAILNGAGDKAFVAGADVGEFAGRTAQEQREVYRNRRVYDALAEFPKPVICAVNGIANGAGLHFAVEADIILGTRHAVFMDSHVNVGQVGALENIGLAKRLPLGTALRITLMGKKYRMEAKRADQLGLLDELYDSREQRMDGAMEIAKIISGNSPSAMRRSKEAIWQSLELPLAESLANGWNLICDQRSHPDAQEGLAAFKEKRPPNWQR